jgi:hypothetical protein
MTWTTCLTRPRYDPASRRATGHWRLTWLRQGSLADLSVRPIALITTIPGICRTELSSNPVSVVPETSGYRHRRQRTERSPGRFRLHHDRPGARSQANFPNVTRHCDRPDTTRSRPAQLCVNTTPNRPDTKIAETKHGGLIGGHDRAYSSGRGYDFTGLVRVAGDQGRWPHILVMGFSNRRASHDASDLLICVTDMSVTLTGWRIEGAVEPAWPRSQPLGGAAVPEDAGRRFGCGGQHPHAAARPGNTARVW